jgi:hypothetical protein
LNLETEAAGPQVKLPAAGPGTASERWHCGRPDPDGPAGRGLRLGVASLARALSLLRQATRVTHNPFQKPIENDALSAK